MGLHMGKEAWKAAVKAVGLAGRGDKHIVICEETAIGVVSPAVAFLGGGRC